MKEANGSFSLGSDIWPGVSKLIEEMGELNQVLGKLIQMRGATEYWDGSNLFDRLHDEIADVEAAIDFLKLLNHLDNDRVTERASQKLDLFIAWHKEQS